MQKTKGKNNAQSLLGVYKILSDNYIRKILDEVHPSYAFPMFSFIFEELCNSGDIDEFRSYNHNLLVALDGTQYYPSQAIQCDCCSQTKHKDKDGNDVSITYSHKVVIPVIVKPGKNKVISLIPELITPQDGHDKQDCENAAAKRWIRTYGPKLKQPGTTLTGDDLYWRRRNPGRWKNTSLFYANQRQGERTATETRETYSIMTQPGRVVKTFVPGPLSPVKTLLQNKYKGLCAKSQT
ncbi:MAG: hypothetical protein GY950_20455 [bacterium]|nr:hypothetical protein [bacterium]